MNHNLVVWIDDDVGVFTGLEAYLEEELEKIDHELLIADNYERAEEFLNTRTVKLLIFDLILMSDSRYASLRRRLGLELAEVAITKNIKLFFAYSVISEAEVERSWKDILVGMKLAGADLSFDFSEKGRESVKHVLAKIMALLQGSGRTQK